MDGENTGKRAFLAAELRAQWQEEKPLCKHSYLKFGTQDRVSVKAVHVMKQKLLGDDL